MPETVAALLVAEIGLTTAQASIAGYAIVTTGTLALSYGAQALFAEEKRNDQQITVRQAVGPRRRGHGRDKLGGTIFFFDTAKYQDTNNKVLTRGVVYCVGPITILEFWLGDVKTSLPGGSGGVVPDSVYQGKVAIEGYNGIEDQPASPACLKFSYWGADCQLKGLAYSVVVATPLKKGSEIFPEGAPDVRIVADLAACYDPRDPSQNPADDATWQWSENAAIVLLDYLTHESGYGIALDDIDLPSFIAMANVCDELIPLVIPDPNGEAVEPRYRSWGSYTYDEERATVLARYLDAMDGEIYQTGEGKVAVRGGRWQPPTVTIDESMIIGWASLERKSRAFDTFTRIKGTYTSPFHDFQPTEADPWDDLPAQQLLGVIGTERDFRRAPSHSQCRRLMKIAMAKGNPAFRFNGLKCSPAALAAYGETMVNLSVPSLGISGTFLITRSVLSVGDFAQVIFDLISLDASAYAWDPAEEGQQPPLPDTYN